MGRRRTNLVGHVSGRLTAVRPTERRSGTSVVWECRCFCGNTCFVPANYLSRKDASKRQRSCGCLGKQQVMEMIEQHKARGIRRRTVAIYLRSAGWSCIQIAAELGVTRQRVYQLLEG